MSQEDNHHQAGVGLMMSPAAYRTMLKWTPINERILFARFATTQTKLSVIVCYAPTNGADDDVKDSFYETLQAVTKDIPKHDVLCVVGDLNAKERIKVALGKSGQSERRLFYDREINHLRHQTQLLASSSLPE
ncbi:hypothetical protein QYM36_017182 [Artemia franciscana]|uniref:Endonuclease/exonuclease/phosphatase domain-containing protein n=1 Tax=Artemia franciscana TaxID=6661 RepID=A0AA88H546_ARTSF|nr:hypothetical protein QYM36_017182 [Artemia franciscana]